MVERLRSQNQRKEEEIIALEAAVLIEQERYNEAVEALEELEHHCRLSIGMHGDGLRKAKKVINKHKEDV